LSKVKVRGGEKEFVTIVFCESKGKSYILGVKTLQEFSSKIELEAESKGMPIRRTDAMIAAITINNGATLYIFDSKHFSPSKASNSNFSLDTYAYSNAFGEHASMARIGHFFSRVQLGLSLPRYDRKL